MVSTTTPDNSASYITMKLLLILADLDLIHKLDAQAYYIVDTFRNPIVMSILAQITVD